MQWETDHEVVTLKKFACATNRDLANELGVPPGTIGQYIGGYSPWPMGVREKTVRFLRARAERSVQGRTPPAAAPAPTPTDAEAAR